MVQFSRASSRSWTSLAISTLSPSGLIVRRFVSSRQSARQFARKRFVHVKATPSTTSINPPHDLSEQTRNIPKLSGSGPFPQTVSFEVLGAPHSLLSVALPASATLYTRRGTLVGVTSNGDINDAVSTLSVLKPIRRATLGIPFLYQNISSPTALTCLLATNSPNTTFAVIELDGAIDWMVTQRKALLAWTGHSLTTKPILNRKMSPAHWGSSRISGRGLAALIGKGQVYQIVLQDAEEMVVHPNNLLAYSITSNPPKPYRLAQTSLRLQVPKMLSLRGRFSTPEFFKNMAKTETYKAVATVLYNMKIWSRRSLWGDRLFMKFRGPITILIQSRAAQISDVLTKKEVDDMSRLQPGGLDSLDRPAEIEQSNKVFQIEAPTTMKVAQVQVGGKVSFEDGDAKDFTSR